MFWHTQVDGQQNQGAGNVIHIKNGQIPTLAGGHATPTNGQHRQSIRNDGHQPGRCFDEKGGDESAILSAGRS